MRAIVCQKIDSRNQPYGIKIGGFMGSSTAPSSIETLYLENVTSVEETVQDVTEIPVYAITHKTGSDETSHVSEYAINKYNVTVTSD